MFHLSVFGSFVLILATGYLLDLPKEGWLAHFEFAFLILWMLVVGLSYTRVSETDIYRHLWGTNNKRFGWLLGVWIGFLVLCSVMGRGQPMVYGFSDLVQELQITLQSENAKSALESTEKKARKFLQLDKYARVLGWDFEPKEPGEEIKKKRPFFGLPTWSHWLIWLLYIPFVLIYGVASRRDELEVWVERRKQESDQRNRGSERVAQQKASPAGGEHQIATTGRLVKWMDFTVGIADFILNIIGSRMRK